MENAERRPGRTKTQRVTRAAIEENRGLSVYSEAIAQYIVDKLISFSITLSDQNQLEKELNPFSFQFIRDILNHSINVNFMMHDRDDLHLKPGLVSHYRHISTQSFDQLTNPQNVSQTINRTITNEPNNLAAIYNYIERDSVHNNSQLNNILPAEPLRTEQTENENFSKDPLFFDNAYYGVNNWTMVEQPVI